MARIACIGAAHVDRKGRAHQEIVPRTSNPVEMRVVHGGVARNVAEILRRLGADVTLVSRLGRDADGDSVLAHLRACGIDVCVTRSESLPTASYTALIEPDGELMVALADMGIYDEISPGVLEAAIPVLAGCPIWFLDANLPEAALRHLVSRKPPGTCIAVDAVSVPKAERLRSLLSGIDVLFLNAAEAAFLAGRSVGSRKDAEGAARAIRSGGAKAVFLSLGADGNLAQDGRESVFLKALKVRVRDVTGAGDALVAGTLFGLAKGWRLRDSLALGQGCSALVLESDETVPANLGIEAALARTAERPPGST